MGGEVRKGWDLEQLLNCVALIVCLRLKTLHVYLLADNLQSSDMSEDWFWPKSTAFCPCVAVL